MIKIYLSPSNQPYNLYCVGDTNEKAQMEALAQKIKDILDAEYECETVMATLSMGIRFDERPKEAKDKGCDIYLAIHSNARSEGCTETVAGAVCFYHPEQPLGRALAANISKELNAICPVKSTLKNSVESGMNAFGGHGYGEIRSPYLHGGMTPVLAETNFHDNPETAQWMINRKDEIARAYVRALVNTLNIPKKAK